ncbi:hypothetical protein [Peribacillus saganii]|nr:hypothetical protein [Peribacillus saganii]
MDSKYEYFVEILKSAYETANKEQDITYEEIMTHLENELTVLLQKQ